MKTKLIRLKVLESKNQKKNTKKLKQNFRNPKQKHNYQILYKEI